LPLNNIEDCSLHRVKYSNTWSYHPNSSKSTLDTWYHFKILLTTCKSISDMASEYMCELVSIRKSSRKCRWNRLRRILEMCRLLRLLSKKHTCSRLLSQMNTDYCLNLLFGFNRHFILAITEQAICMSPSRKDALLVNMHYF
jgi:hypothetical protein